MRPYIAQFLRFAADNEPVEITKSLEGTIPDEIQLSTTETRMLEDTRPDEEMMMWKEHKETATIEGTEPDDCYFLDQIKTANVEGTDPDDLLLSGNDVKKTFTREVTEPDELFFQKITETLEQTEPDEIYFNY